MAIFKCKMCGGNLEIAEDTLVCTCEFCGTEQTLPKMNSDKKENMYDRANHFRRNNDFDKAMGIYEQILNEDNTDSEAYWSIVICRYGIEYVEDPLSHKRVPTVNRAQYTSIYADEDYKAAIKNADDLQKTIYENEAKTIDDIQKGILAISEKEEPFDVFICYKETDESGRRTPDSVLANDLYHQLTQEGFKVFFSRITLEDKLGQEYEPYIFAALNSAKVMVVLGTKPDYFKAVWVKNEWARFLGLIKSGAKKILIPAYKDMDPYDLPEEFSHLQAQDMTKLGFMQDLIRGIKKLTDSEKEKSVEKETVVVQHNVTAGGTTPTAQVQRGNMALEDGEWEKADSFFEEALNLNPQCAEAYLGKQMAKCKKSNVSLLTQYYISKYEFSETEKLEACPEATSRKDAAVSKYMILEYLSENEIKKQYKFDRTYASNLSFRKQQKSRELSELSGEKLLVRAQQYATGETKNLIDKMMADITAALDSRIATSQQDDNEQIESIKSSYEIHINGADVKVKELYNNALAKQESTYISRVSQMNASMTISDYEKVRDLFKGMHGYKDTNTLAEKCQAEIERLKEEESLEIERLEDARRKETIRRTKKIKIIFAIAASIIVVIIAIFMGVTKVIIPNINYNNAVTLMNSGKYEEAIAAFEELNGYKDSKEVIESIYDDSELEKMASSDIGDTVFFGNYKGNKEWVVLAKDQEKILIISKHAIEKEAYNTAASSVTWEECTLRRWLNGTFLETAFSSDEKLDIIESSIENDENDEYGTDGGNNTTDKVFLLSIDDANNYYISNSDNKRNMGWWWLRSPGKDNLYAAIVMGGKVSESGTNVDYKYGLVRPAMWIDISECAKANVIESEEIYETKEKSESEVDLDEKIKKLFDTYYKACATGDDDTLLSICDPTDEEKIIRICAQSKYIEDYNDITCYSKKCIQENSYIVFCCYSLKYKYIDTPAPGMASYYVKTRDDGSLYIYDGELTDEEVEYINELSEQQDVTNLMNSVNEKYKVAVARDMKLKNFMNGLSKILDEDVENEIKHTETIDDNSYSRVVVNEKARVRKGPDLQAEICGIVEGGTVLEFLTEADGWSKVVFNGDIAYIRSDFVSWY